MTNPSSCQCAVETSRLEAPNFLGTLSASYASRTLYQLGSNILVLLLVSASLELNAQSHPNSYDLPLVLDLECPLVCPGDIVSLLPPVPLADDHDLRQKFDWKSAGCIRVPYQTDGLKFEFNSIDSREDIDWVLYVQKTKSLEPVQEISSLQSITYDFSGPVLGQEAVPFVGPTSFDTTFLSARSESEPGFHVLFYTSWFDVSSDHLSFLVDILHSQLKPCYTPSDFSIFISPNPVNDQLYLDAHFDLSNLGSS